MNKSKITETLAFNGIPFNKGISYEEAACIVLKNLRKEHKVNQETMAQIIGLSKSGYNKLENGVYKLKLNTIFQFCNHFNVTRKEFFSDIELVFETSNK